MTRRSRLLTVLFSLFALLLSGGALAGYACPGVAKALEVAHMTAAGMPCADSMSRAMDEEQSHLCHAHCQTSSQTADAYQPPVIAGSLQLGPVLTVGAVRSPPLPVRHRAAPSARETGPPLAIRNCCFRI